MKTFTASFTGCYEVQPAATPRVFGTFSAVGFFRSAGFDWTPQLFALDCYRSAGSRGRRLLQEAAAAPAQRTLEDDAAARVTGYCCSRAGQLRGCSSSYTIRLGSQPNFAKSTAAQKVGVIACCCNNRAGCCSNCLMQRRGSGSQDVAAATAQVVAAAPAHSNRGGSGSQDVAATTAQVVAAAAA